MTYKKSEALVIVSTILLLIIIIIFSTHPKRNQLKEVAAMATVHMRETNAPTKTPTNTPTYTVTPKPTYTLTSTPVPSYTPTSTPTLTPSHTPTITPTPTKAPCLATIKAGERDPRIYMRPSTGVLNNSISLSSGARVKLYSRLEDEPWWLVSLETNYTPQGWVQVTDVTPESTCSDIPTVGLERGVGLSPEQVVVADSFNANEYEWVSNDGSPVERAFDDQVILVLSASSDIEVAHLQDGLELDKFALYSSFSRESRSLNDSYVGIRIVSSETQDTYIEVIFLRKDCAHQYRGVVNGAINNETIAYPLDSTGCTNKDSIFVSLNIQLDEMGKNLIVSGTYNDKPLIDFTQPDVQKLFEEGTIEFVSYDTRMEIDYVLIGKTE